MAEARKVSLARVPLDRFREGSSLYRQAVSDLAYARMLYRDHRVARELEQLVGQAHGVLYQAGRSQSRNWLEFFRETWPRTVREASGPILFATAVFWAGAVVGFLGCVWNPALENFFVSPAMRSALESGHLWTESLTRTAPSAASKIGVNNIQVSLLAWGLGVTAGIGTTWLMVFNGLMLGGVAAACLRVGMLGPLAEFVIGHGSLELPAIWLAGGAGLLFAQAQLFPGRYRRGVELRQKSRKAVLIFLGVIPLLTVACVIEAFVSPGPAPGYAKALLGLGLGLALLAYILTAGRTPGTAT